MTALKWNLVGERIYEAGVDRGVLYLPEGTGIPWNGLINVSEKMSGNNESPLYYDGTKFGDHLTVGDFSASLKAFTYPDEFQEFEGIIRSRNGFFVANQPSSRFNLSYRTMIGNDVDGVEYGYKIHVLYNLTAIPSQKNYNTMAAADAMEFEWTISAIPGEIPGFRPTAHLVFDTRYMSPYLIPQLEAILYGDATRDASLPPIASLVSFINSWALIKIIDNFDGTWTAVGPDEYITMLDATRFQITNANAEYSDPYTYRISDTDY